MHGMSRRYFSTEKFTVNSYYIAKCTNTHNIIWLPLQRAHNQLQLQHINCGTSELQKRLRWCTSRTIHIRNIIIAVAAHSQRLIAMPQHVTSLTKRINNNNQTSIFRILIIIIRVKRQRDWTDQLDRSAYNIPRLWVFRNIYMRIEN